MSMKPGASSGPILGVRDLAVTFPTERGDLRAVDGLSFEVERGRTLAIVGESGSGKSTAGLALLGLLPAGARVSGSATFDGGELLGASERDLRAVRGAGIAMIFQDPQTSLNPVMRVGEHIAEGLRAHGASRRAAAARAIELLRMVGIADPERRARQYPHEFSGGMRQRVMIAAAIAAEPAVMIADEPTTALDVTVQAQILELLWHLRERAGMGMVLITHDLGVVAAAADEVLVMYAGRAVEHGPVGAVFASPQHPYTWGLLRSVPRPDGGRLTGIEGAPPSMLRVPDGCAFHPRCAYAFDECRGAVPALARRLAHLDACILPADRKEQERAR